MTMTDTEAKALEAWNDVRIKRHEPVLVTASAAMICSPSAFIALGRAIEREEATEARHAAEMRELKERFSEAASLTLRMLTPYPLARDEAEDILIPFILPAPDPMESVVEQVARELGIVGASSLHTIRADDFRSKLHVALRKIGKVGE